MKQDPGKSAPTKAARPSRRRKRLLSGDRLLTLAGFAIAGCAAFLPWYAVIGGHGLGIRNHGLRLSGHDEGKGAYGFGGAMRPFGRPDVEAAKADFDAMATGGIPTLDTAIDTKRKKTAPDIQPFPGRPFRVVHVVNGQALIADDGGMYLVGIGSKLPDKSRLKSFRKENGHWAVVTSNGAVVGR